MVALLLLTSANKDGCATKPFTAKKDKDGLVDQSHSYFRDVKDALAILVNRGVLEIVIKPSKKNPGTYRLHHWQYNKLPISSL